MANDWIKWVKGLASRPEIVRISSALSTDRRRTACACMELWEWADSVTIDGRVDGVTPRFVDEYLGVPGFFDAMAAAGWITQTPTGIAFPNFTRHNGESAKRRAMDADRKQAARESVRKMSASNADTMRTREEKRREEKKQQQQQCTPDAKPTEPKPAAAAAGAFRQWAETQAKRPEWLPTGKGWITADEWESVGIAGAGLISEGEYAAIVREAKDSRHSLKNPAGFILRKLRTLAKGRKGTE